MAINIPNLLLLQFGENFNNSWPKIAVTGVFIHIFYANFHK